MPARLGDIIRVSRTFGLDVEKPKKGSHWKFKRAGARTYPIPAHNGEKEEISDQYIRALCRNFGVDFEAFRKLL